MADDETESEESSSAVAWLITIIAVIAAAAPHAFFPPPLQLHMAGEMKAWLGIAIWAPALLAGIGFFFGVEFNSRFERPKLDPAIAGGAAVLAVIGYAVLLALIFPNLWTEMASMRPWGELGRALPMWAGLGALYAVFWQGYVQHDVMSDWSPVPRVLALGAMAFVVFAPFFATAPEAAGAIVAAMVVDAILSAAIFELGVTVWGVMIVRAFFAGSFIWFQQALLL